MINKIICTFRIWCLVLMTGCDIFYSISWLETIILEEIYDNPTESIAD